MLIVRKREYVEGKVKSAVSERKLEGIGKLALVFP